MRKQRHKPPKASPRIIDKLMLALSDARQVDGIWIGSYRTSEVLTRVEHALLLIKQHSPLHYSRITSELERVWISLLPDGLAQYNRSLKACVLDERFVADSATSIERIASVIVHEATHARIERCGIEYDEYQRTRIEAICFRRELAFAARLPDSTGLQQHIAEYLDWCPANPDYFRDAHFREREGDGEIVVLRHIGAPDWLIRAHPTLKSMIGRARRLFRIAWARGQ
jgi:hypothetical protein